MQFHFLWYHNMINFLHACKDFVQSCVDTSHSLMINRTDNSFIKTVGGIILALGGFFIEKLSVLTAILLIAVLLDRATGFSAALYNKQVDSKKSRKGWVKLIFYFFLMVIVELIARYTWEYWWTSVAVYSIQWYLILNEIISLLENMEKVWIKEVAFLTSRLKIVREKIQWNIDDKLDKPN